MNGKVVLIDIDIDALSNAEIHLKNLGFEDYYTLKCDITNESSIISVKEKILDKCSKIDILINSAGLTHNIMSKNGNFFNNFEKTDNKIWEKGLEVNLTATQLCCKVIGTQMVKSNGGSIINIASDIGVISPNHKIYEPDEYGYKGVDFNSPAFYSVSKAGVIHLTKYLACYWAKKNLRVNAISPAGVFRNQSADFVKKLSNEIPMGRMALPNEFKGAIIYLSSSASSFVTGHNLLIDGGRTIW